MLSVIRSGAVWNVIERTGNRRTVIRTCESFAEAKSCLKQPDSVRRPAPREYRDSRSEWDSMFNDQVAQRRELVEVDHRDVYYGWRA